MVTIYIKRYIIKFTIPLTSNNIVMNPNLGFEP